MAAPTIIGSGTFVNLTTGTLTPGLPAGIAVDDILVAFINSRGAPRWTHASYNEASGSPQHYEGSESRLSVWWRRVVGGESAPVGPSDGNSCGRIIAVRGCIKSGTPFESAAGGVDAGAGTLVTWSALNTTGADRLILASVARTGDNASSLFDSWTGGLSEVWDHGFTAGAGGGLALGSMEAAAAGSHGAFTSTIGISADFAWHRMAMIPLATARNQAVVVT